LLPFWLSIGTLSLVQAALVAAPRPAASTILDRLRSRWWALILPLSIVVVIAAVAADSSIARLLTYLALVAVPPLAAAGLAWVVRGGRPPLALLVLPLAALAWAAEGTLSGQSAALALSALACLSLGWLLACVVPGRWLKLGIYAMAAVDAYLVAGDLLQGPNAVINSAAPGGGLPRLQLVHFGSAIMGFADIFIAAVLGALLALGFINDLAPGIGALKLQAMAQLLQQHELEGVVPRVPARGLELHLTPVGIGPGSSGREENSAIG